MSDKMFYTNEEVQQKLGISADRVKALVDSGELREFRDGSKVMFKASEVDSLEPGPDTGDLGGAGQDSEIGLMPLDSAAGMEQPSEIDLGGGLDADQVTGLGGDTGSEIGLVPMGSGSQSGIVPEGLSDQVRLDDSSEGAGKDDTVITTHGTNVMDDSSEMLEMVDPLAQAETMPDDVGDQIDLDSSSSGSGLLDLSREADDTSLGAELLEEIYPGAEDLGGESQVPTLMDQEVALQPAAGMSDMSGELGAQEAPLMDYIAAPRAVDPASNSYGAMMVVPLVLLVYLGFVAASAIVGVRPRALTGIGQYVWHVAIGSAVVSLVVVGVGSFLAGSGGKLANQGRSKPKKEPKAKKKKKEPKAKKTK